VFCTQGIPLHTETDTFIFVLSNVMCFSLLFLVFCALHVKEKRKTALLSCEMLPITQEDGVQNAL
jgi:heme/copper-type cytochrome/quinol oxidase subunit 3